METKNVVLKARKTILVTGQDGAPHIPPVREWDRCVHMREGAGQHQEMRDQWQGEATGLHEADFDRLRPAVQGLLCARPLPRAHHFTG